ncbi:MAG: hypothetical protein ACXVFF_16430 [Gaiellaceae bacterium]
MTFFPQVATDPATNNAPAAVTSRHVQVSDMASFETPAYDRT